MIGTKTLKEIREELRVLLGKDGEDPIDWLNKRMAVAPQDRRTIESIREFLEGPIKPKSKRKKKRKSAKKR